MPTRQSQFNEDMMTILPFTIVYPVEHSADKAQKRALEAWLIWMI
jgi:hypothetical protein